MGDGSELPSAAVLRGRLAGVTVMFVVGIPAVGVATHDVSAALAAAGLVGIGVALALVRLQRHRFFAGRGIGGAARAVIVLLADAALALLVIALVLAIAGADLARHVLAVAYGCGGLAGLYGLAAVALALGESDRG